MAKKFSIACFCTILLTLSSCTPKSIPESGTEPGPPPQILISHVLADRVQLSEVKRKLSLTIDYTVAKGKPSTKKNKNFREVSDYQIRTRAYVVNVKTNKVVAELENERVPVPPDDITRHEEFFVDSVALKLPPGSYTAQAIILAATPSRINDSLEDLYGDWLKNQTKDFSIFTSKLIGFQVLDMSFGAGYRTLVDSGRADHVLRGLSQLVMHARATGQFDAAEKEAERIIGKYKSNPEVEELTHVFRLWQVDDIVSQGDPERAVRLLEAEAKTYADRFVLGIPYTVATLDQQATIWRGEGKHKREIAVYDKLITQFPKVDARAGYRVLRGKANLRAGNWDAARKDFQSIVDQGKQCQEKESYSKPDSKSNMPKPASKCPDEENLTKAQDIVSILQGNRSWFHKDAKTLGSELKHAFESGDITALDKLAQAPNFQFGNPGGHMIRSLWQNQIRSYFEPRLAPDRFKLHVPARLNFNQKKSQILLVQDTQREEGSPSSIVLMIEQTPFGSQWRGVGGLRIDYFDDPLAKPPSIVSGGGGFPGRGGGVSPPAPILRMKASWAPGTHMRAGGMRLEFESAKDMPITDFIHSFLRFDKCGSGIPGYFYNTNGTHKGRNIYSIDFVKGATSLCVPSWVPFAGDICLPDIQAATIEWVEAVAKLIPGIEDPVRHGAYLSPIHLGHAGLVVNVETSHPDGDKDGSNRIDIAAWEYSPTSIKRLTAKLTDEGDFEDILSKFDNGVVARIKTISPLPDFWIKYQHLAYECERCAPSLGMWVDRGRIIGRVDDTGAKSFMSHLHIAVYGSPKSSVLSSSKNSWITRMQNIENDFIEENDDGKCIKSSNELISDTDDDGISDSIDNCTIISNPDQADSNNDNIGDACFADNDNDGIQNEEDSCPDTHDTFGSFLDVNFDEVNDWTLDIDGDGINNSCDPDSDGDGILNESDICMFGNDRDDMDGDGLPDFCDPDPDGDGASRPNGSRSAFCPPQPDLFPFDPTRIGDYDKDGIDDLNDVCPCSHINPNCLPNPPVKSFGELQRYKM